MSETAASYGTYGSASTRRPSGKNLSLRGRAVAKRRFLDALEPTANVAGACRAARISRTIAYEWRAQDPAFATAWQNALDNALDDLEQIAFQRAREGSDQLAMFLLRAHRPEKYREVVNHEASGEVVVKVVYVSDWRGQQAHERPEQPDAPDPVADFVADLVDRGAAQCGR